MTDIVPIFVTVVKPTNVQRNRFKKFSTTHWGPSTETAENEKLRFFDIPYATVAGYDTNKNIIGLLNIHLKEITFENVKFTLGGIGGVVVHKDLRHKGIASEILKHAISSMKKMRIDVSMLCTDIPKLGKLYKNVGFVPLGRKYYFYDKNGREISEAMGMIKAIKSPQIYKLITKSQSIMNVGKSNF